MEAERAAQIEFLGYDNVEGQCHVAAQAYLHDLLPMSLPYDHVFDQGWRFGLKFRLVTPTPCAHDAEIASTIVAPPGPGRKFHWTRRRPAYVYRLGNEWQRVKYGLTEAWRERHT